MSLSVFVRLWKSFKGEVCVSCIRSWSSVVLWVVWMLVYHLNSPDQCSVVPSSWNQPLTVRTEAHRLHTPTVSWQAATLTVTFDSNYGHHSNVCIIQSIIWLQKRCWLLLLLKLWIMWGISFWVIMKWNTPVSMCVHSVLERLQILTVRSWDALANSWPSQENTHDFTGPADHYTFNAFLHT